ncbi:MAG: 3-phosphoshikimate 1-carboxyvinyltransferase [Candidatus Devosia phytovorans]|uniref:3-phosphoshikimate 1-carboxyvinyltransferase n=1 Tax=Candidatus Devosia phytovorans TaxID=3121372 RepID=A0AAJ5VV07_9HYPH|nr:3-phosphoshikimate 1-carboxyvinyltransferase [Devosia sp.]WEK04082.1 MAG: 3-phosphoshikimate 1-carboxyvinyltransferase [Devosia sp.]
MTDQIPATPAPLACHGASPLAGHFATPGDKAISHRALILAALAVGQTTIEGLLDSDDVRATAAALGHLGVSVEEHDDVWHVHGLGVAGLMAPQVRLDMGNSGTGLRLLLGLLAPYDFPTRFTGGPTLTRRPLRALLDALAPIGVVVEETVDGGLPLTRRGPSLPLPFHHVMAAPSDQIKSALLLAAAQIPGTSTIVEPVSTSDSTEKLLADFGASISVTQDDGGGATITVNGLTELRPRPLTVPGDPSSAAYAVVGALVVPGSDLVVSNVLINPTRTGLIDTLLEMGGDIQFINQRELGGEPIADLRVRSSRLKGISVSANHAASMLDDIPVLAVAAAYADGETMIEGLAELRHQECDRLAATAGGLAANKVTVTEGEDSLTIVGTGKVDGGGTVESRADHRIAMSFLVLGLASKRPVTLDDTNAIAASFPGFVVAMAAAGARFETVKGR